MVDKGRGDKIKGKAKEMAGKATSDHEQEFEGKLEQARGEAKKIRGKAQERAENAMRPDRRDRRA
ncbi:CsbD family protein [Streptomyces sp. NPDC047042]|uniref:CsbD family protein n=1 Tax=Streptomyces sp. NPDC047042 TaxID=3154807 RepID=UPI003402B025